MAITSDIRIVLCILIAMAKATTDCSLRAKTAIPVFVSLDGGLEIVCPPNHCSGEYMIEHLNHNTSRYEIIQQGSHRANVTIKTLSDVGYFRCSKRCNDGRSDSPYCYFNTVVQPTTLEWNMSVGTVVDESYSLSCSATGYPSPFVHAEVQPHENCSHSYDYQYTKVDSYTGKAMITIPRVSMQCARVYCRSGEIDGVQTLNVTNVEENTSASSSTMPTAAPSKSATETTNEPSTFDESMDSTIKGDGGSVSSNTPRSTILLLSTVIAVCIYRE